MQKNTMSKKLIEQQLMLKIRMSLLLAKCDLPPSYVESVNQRIEAGLKSLEDRLNLHHPSAWFERSFVNSMSYYGGYCWSARVVNGSWKISILEQLPEHKQEAVL